MTKRECAKCGKKRWARVIVTRMSGPVPTVVDSTEKHQTCLPCRRKAGRAA